MAIVEVSVIPMGTDEPSVSSYISSCYKVLENETKLKHQLTPMSTIIEGDVDKVIDAVKKMHKVPFSEGVKRVVTTITIDERTDKPLSMESSVESVIQDIQ